MKVWFICGYRGDLANKAQRSSEDYWDAYFYVWAVKVGSYKKPFNIHTRGGRIPIRPDNFDLVRRKFGAFIAHTIKAEDVQAEPLLVPVPSKDGLRSASEFRSLTMIEEAMAGTDFAGSTLGALRWTRSLPKAHEKGDRTRANLQSALWADPKVAGRDVVLIDDILTTGASLLASRDVLSAAGANVLGAVTCGRAIHDLETKPFGRQFYMLDREIAEYPKG